MLDQSNRRRITVNINKIAQNAKGDNIIVIPGKVLGLGRINTALTVAALSYSEKAKKKITSNGGKCLSITEILHDVEPVKITLLR